MIDLRSDTVTQPTPEMYVAMANAPLGDDVFNDDPTVIELETLAADICGHEAGLFCPSGTMTNQVALKVLTRPGDAVLFDEECHMVFYEGGGPAVFSQVITQTVPSKNGVMAIDDLERRFMTRSLMTPGTSLLCIENTNNRAGGAVIDLEQMRGYREFADGKGIKLYLDGARVFNAATALGCDVREITSMCDAVSICLSKGLGAPVGSVLLGSKQFIEEARRVRKCFGGGMRQSGILAACGIISLNVIRHKLADDHRRAAEINKGLQSVPGAVVKPEETVTNFVMVHTSRPAADWLQPLRDQGVSCLAAAPNRLRLVLHHQIEDTAIPKVISVFKAVATQLSARE